ncbi:DeoR family transcriptional regulator, partial [Escherichia coli]|nr:DeoR family transcriptional regulator [Escherichia coli]
MHVEERDSLILDLIGKTGFVSFKNLEATIPASPATLRRDLDRLEGKGVIQRVRGGARLVEDEAGERT